MAEVRRPATAERPGRIQTGAAAAGAQKRNQVDHGLSGGWRGTVTQATGKAGTLVGFQIASGRPVVRPPSVRVVRDSELAGREPIGTGDIRDLSDDLLVLALGQVGISPS